MAVKKRVAKKLPKYDQEELETYKESKSMNRRNISDIKYKKTFKNKKQKELFDKILENRIVFVRGCAGTGKTIIALMASIECLINKEYNINKIALTKPIVEVSKSLGALPGEITDKTAVYFTHFYDNLEKLVGKSNANFMKSSEMISETIINYIRGNTFGSYNELGEPVGAICILDEAQNTTINEIKTFISRMGENTKLIICGDSDQVDLKLGRNDHNGFDHCWEILQNIKDIDFMEFTEDDIVREKLLIDIMKRFKANKPL